MRVATDKIEVELNEPLVFRTASADVCKSSIEAGSLWLRSDQYYRDLEDQIRNDPLEGVNCGTPAVPLRTRAGGVDVQIRGTGTIGQAIVPHYLLSLHGASISDAQRKAFGGHTFGVQSLSRLSIDILYQASKQIRCIGYRYGQVVYQHTAFALTLFSNGSAICLGGDPPLSLGALNTDVLRKRPVVPFVEQDEWRIVVFTEGYLGNDAATPLRILVAPSHFYQYLGDDVDA